MKRCWFGFALLICLLIGGILATRFMTENHSAIAARLEDAAAAALAEDWPRAEAHLHGARQQWEQDWHFTAAFADHEPMEEIDSVFAQAEVYLACRDREALSAVCTQLSRLTGAVGEAHSLNWWNLL